MSVYRQTNSLYIGFLWQNAVSWLLAVCSCRSPPTPHKLFSWLLWGLDMSDGPRMGWYDSSRVWGGQDFNLKLNFIQLSSYHFRLFVLLGLKSEQKMWSKYIYRAYILPIIFVFHFRITLVSSIFLIVGTAVERYLAVCRPHHYHQVFILIFQMNMNPIQSSSDTEQASSISCLHHALCRICCPCQYP